MKVVILCGGKGTRLREETEYRPKPLVPIGQFPVLWHIMKLYSHHGFNEFVLCLGYKGNKIKEYFMEYDWDSFDFTLDLKTGKKEMHNAHTKENWKITFAETGLETNTGGRVKAVQQYVGNDDFLLTYGDGVTDVDIKNLVDFHKKEGKLATITVVHPQSKFGIVKIDDQTTEFVEKPPLHDWISGGFMVCSPAFFDHLDDSMFEQTVLPTLAKEQELAIYKHERFWHAMDTYKDYLDLNKMWEENAPWKVWQ